MKDCVSGIDHSLVRSGTKTCVNSEGAPAILPANSMSVSQFARDCIYLEPAWTNAITWSNSFTVGNGYTFTNATPSVSASEYAIANTDGTPLYATKITAIADGGNLSKGANGKLFATSQLVRDSSVLVGDAQTELFNTYDGNKNLFAAPAFYNTNVVLSTVATTPCTRTTTTIGDQTVYQTYYETGSLGTNSNVDTVTWYFQNPNNVFRVIITELSSGTITYLSTAEDKFLAGEGITCAGCGAQTWNAMPFNTPPYSQWRLFIDIAHCRA